MKVSLNQIVRYLRQRAFFLAIHLAFRPLSHSDCHRLCCTCLRSYLCTSYWAVPTQYGNWAQITVDCTTNSQISTSYRPYVNRISSVRTSIASRQYVTIYSVPSRYCGSNLNRKYFNIIKLVILILMSTWNPLQGRNHRRFFSVVDIEPSLGQKPPPFFSVVDMEPSLGNKPQSLFICELFQYFFSSDCFTYYVRTDNQSTI